MKKYFLSSYIQCYRFDTQTFFSQYSYHRNISIHLRIKSKLNISMHDVINENAERAKKMYKIVLTGKREHMRKMEIEKRD